VDVGSLASSVAQGAERAVMGKLSAEAMQLIQRAEDQAAEIRGKAQSLADRLKQEGYQQADSLTAKAGGNPLKATAASLAASQLRKQTDDKAASIVQEASAQADSLVAAARRQAEQLGGTPARAGQVATERRDSLAPN
jgi:cell division septum initiation protein DivIVA